MVGAVSPGSRTLKEVINRRVIESLSRFKVEIRFDRREKRQPTANYAADYIDVVL